MIKTIIINLIFLLTLSSSVFSQSMERPPYWGYKVNSSNFENLFKLNDDIYRSDQPNRGGFVEVRNLGVQSVLNLRSSHDDRAIAKGLGLRLYGVQMEVEELSVDEIVDALRVVRDAPKPLLIHCHHGSDRSGAVIAVYRMVMQGWSKEQAIIEMRYGGYGFHEKYENIVSLLRNLDLKKVKQQLNNYSASTGY